MSQHDYIINNQSGALFRSDLNSALSAIVGINSGASAPSTTYAYMLWVDTTNGWLKQRNSANTAWISVMRLSTAAGSRLPQIAKSSTYTVVEADFGSLIDCSATLTLNLTAAATLGDGWFCIAKNSSASGTITLDPNGAELIDGIATAALAVDEAVIIICNGTSFKTVGRGSSNGQLRSHINYTASSTWTKPAGLQRIRVRVQGGGGSGMAGSSTQAGGGGGGGGYAEKLIPAASLGATETVTVGAIAGTSSFGAHVTCTGGATATSGTGGAAGTATGGDVNMNGTKGQSRSSGSTKDGGGGGHSILGTAGYGGKGDPGANNGDNAAGRGAGGGGGGGGSSTSAGLGRDGCVIVEEYF